MSLIAEPRRAKEVATLQVFRGDIPIASLGRIPGGCRFLYDPEFVLKHRGDSSQSVASTLPLREQPYTFHGSSLPPYFAGLLPEGLHYQALVRGLEVPSSDHFSVLAVTGRNPVGDIWVRSEGGLETSGLARIDYKDLAHTTFADLQVQAMVDRVPVDAMTLPGIRPKISVGVVSHALRSRAYRRESFLKLSPSLYPKLAENEAFFMALARSMKMRTADVRVVTDAAGQSALLVQRFDRVQAHSDNRLPLARLHQEDMCQLLNRDPSHKFTVTPAEISDALSVCTAPLVERLKFFQLYALSYLIGNGNLHAKNIAVQWVEGQVRLAPVFDLHSTLAYGDSRMAMPLGESGDPITRKMLVDYAGGCGVRGQAIER
ncbi:MAG: HipA domain-containing protein, partial [Planctomycetota bacterium]|nr:HipA domain-containing protein [Planctomycetota bacterium]